MACALNYGTASLINYGTYFECQNITDIFQIPSASDITALPISAAALMELIR
jgi:hypothetical protein